MESLLAAVRRLSEESHATVVVALDGPSGSGKSTLAVDLADALHATVVPTDDFFAAEIPSVEWDRCDPRERAMRAIDWRRLREHAIEPLLAGKPARWHAFDFESGARADGTYAMSDAIVERPPKPVVILDGAYSARPELSDLICLKVLVEAPTSVRHERLAAREDSDFLRGWHERWDAAEEHYFSAVRPPSSFDIVVSGVR